MKKVGDLMGASRALVYAYFPDPDRLAEAVLDRHMTWLAEAGVDDGSRLGRVRRQGLGLRARLS
jgi:AcrR family transcriptional regulator